MELCGQRVPFGTDLLFAAENVEGFMLFAEICEDVWTPLPPSTFAALAGATVLTNLSASNITVGKADYRRDLCASQSAKCMAAYLYSGAGPGESTTDLAWDGHALIYENGNRLAESERFARTSSSSVADIDLERLRAGSHADDQLQRHRQRPSGAAAALPHDSVHALTFPRTDVTLQRRVERFPYVPSNPAVLDERCFEVYNIQVHGLMQRLQATGIERSSSASPAGSTPTQALIVCARTMDRLGLPRTNILAYTMPGFATSGRTLRNAHGLMAGAGRQRTRDRHPPVVTADAQGSGPSLCRR